MCEPAAAASAASTIAAQNLYAKLQKLSEDIQLQQSIITAQKETVLKSRQKAIEPQRTGVPTGDVHLVHTHAGTVLQHRAMIVKHYELIQQHKQMVKEQGLHVQNLTSALLNIQQETNVVDELMNTKMAESRTRAIGANPNSTTPPLLSTSPASSSSSSTSLIIVDNYHDYKPTTSRDKSTATQIGPKRTQRTRKYTNERLTTRTAPTATAIDPEILPTATDNKERTSRSMEKELLDDDEPTPTEITTTTIISTITSTTPTSSSTSTTISSSISTTTHTPLHPDKHVRPLEPPSPSLEEPTPLSP